MTNLDHTSVELFRAVTIDELESRTEMNCSDTIDDLIYCVGAWPLFFFLSGFDS